MKGQYRIELYNADVRYFLTVERNITVLRGDSATGKSELIRLLTEYNQSRESSGVTLICEKTCSVLTEEDWQYRLRGMSDRIIFIDEGNAFIRTKDFAKALDGSDNYFVIISRESLFELPYSVKEIYGLRESSASKYKKAERVYNEMYQLYTSFPNETISVRRLLTEDSGSGFQFFDTVYPHIVDSANGKGNVLKHLRKLSDSGQKAVAIVDGAAFGPEMNRVEEWLRWHPGNAIFAPESFEYLILASGVLDVPKNVLDRTFDYADSCRYMSWEQFYTDYLIQMTARGSYPYQKGRLHPFYLTKGNADRILKLLPDKLQICKE